MMAILISIKPEWVQKILNGEKTLEIRKTMPKCELPSKVYIYCTDGTKIFYAKPLSIDEIRNQKNLNQLVEINTLNGKVVAEFTLDKVDLLVDIGAGIHYCDKDDNLLDLKELLDKSCLTDKQIYDYLGESKINKGHYNNGYTWHISNLKIYDKPKELSEFRLPPQKDSCENCFLFPDMCKKVCLEQDRCLFKPPQSWCYIQVLEAQDESVGD